MRYLFVIVLVIALGSTGCGSDSETTQADVQAMPDDDVHTGVADTPMGGFMGGLNTEISLDAEIAGAWSGVRVRVVDSETGDDQTIDMQLGETTALGDSGLTLLADTFVPDFVMDEGGISSRSAETHNPAARVMISEGGAITYEGWLFAAMPEIHPFPHDRYQVLLIEGIPAE